MNETLRSWRWNQNHGNSGIVDQLGFEYAVIRLMATRVDSPYQLLIAGFLRHQQYDLTGRQVSESRLKEATDVDGRKTTTKRPWSKNWVFFFGMVFEWPILFWNVKNKIWTCEINCLLRDFSRFSGVVFNGGALPPSIPSLRQISRFENGAKCGGRP